MSRHQDGNVSSVCGAVGLNRRLAGSKVIGVPLIPVKDMGLPGMTEGERIERGGARSLRGCWARESRGQAAKGHPHGLPYMA